ncbi:MAG: hypothetical protein ABI054_10135, partial [Planctomycetota bacterium]
GTLDLGLGISGLDSIEVLLNSSIPGVCVPTSVYCVAKVDSLGCQPSIGSTGAASASASSGFSIRATAVHNKVAGILLHTAAGRAFTPFQGGHLCLAQPIQSTPSLQSGGSANGADCTGVFAIDMNAFAAGVLGGTPSVYLSTPGTLVDAQFWGRDPHVLNSDKTTLSDALEWVVAP